jgi:hypothetical protein
MRQARGEDAALTLEYSPVMLMKPPSLLQVGVAYARAASQAGMTMDGFGRVDGFQAHRLFSLNDGQGS